MGNLNHNLDEHPETVGFDEPVPAGIYKFEITEGQVTPTSAGTGLVCKIVLKIIEGEHAGRNCWDNFNIKNPSEKAQQIGRGRLSNLCKACGKIGMIEDTSELLGIPILAKIKVLPAEGQYRAKNEVSAYYPISILKEEKEAKKETSFDEDVVPF